jgi:hypothetical protein
MHVKQVYIITFLLFGSKALTARPVNIGNRCNPGTPEFGGLCKTKGSRKKQKNDSCKNATLLHAANVKENPARLVPM